MGFPGFAKQRTSGQTFQSMRMAEHQLKLSQAANTPDISEYLDFDFYDWALYRTNAGLGEVKLGRWIGVSHRVGQLMSYWVFPESGIPISVTTIQRLTNNERNTDEMKCRMEQ